MVVLVMNTASFWSRRPEILPEQCAQELLDIEENLKHNVQKTKLRERTNHCKYYGTIFAVLIAVIGLALLFIYMFTPVFDDRMPSIR